MKSHTRSNVVRAGRSAALLIMMLSSAAVPARDMAGLYTAVVPVADRSQGEFARGVTEALIQVLVKLTGQRRPQDSAAVKPVLAHARSLLVQYGYQKRPVSGDLALRAEFDERALSGELEAAGVSVWGKERPDSLVWLLVDDGKSRHIVSGDDPGPLGDVVTARAAARGIPVLLPLMDIQEARQFSGDAVSGWDAFAATAVSLSGRYATPAVLIAYLRQSVPGVWEARFEIRVSTESFETRQQGDLPELVVEEGLDQLADALARRYAEQGTTASTERIRVSVYGVRAPGDYARVGNYLGSLDAASKLFVRGVAGDHVDFELTVRGGAAALAQAVSFGQVLAPDAGHPGAYQLLH